MWANGQRDGHPGQEPPIMYI